MWRLVMASLRYRSGSALSAAGIVLVLAAAVNLILPIVGAAPSPDDDFKLVYLFPILLLFSSAFVGLGQIVGDLREMRLATHTILPRTKTQVGLAWVLIPCIVSYVALILAEVLMLLILLARGSALEGWRFCMLAYFGGIIAMILQWPLLLGELRHVVHASRTARVAFATVAVTVATFMSLRALRHTIDLDPRVVVTLESIGRIGPESITSSLILHGAAWFMCGVSFVLFRRRRLML